MITHYHITKAMSVAMTAFTVVACILVGVSFKVPMADATPGMLPFGGFILYNEPVPLPNPANFFGVPIPPCPAHIVITDYTAGVPKVIGITLGYSSVGPTFEFYNLYTPGVATVGEYLPVPLPNCVGTPGVYYPVFSAFLNPDFGLYQMGTAALPGF